MGFRGWSEVFFIDCERRGFLAGVWLQSSKGSSGHGRWWCQSRGLLVQEGDASQQLVAHVLALRLILDGDHAFKSLALEFGELFGGVVDAGAKRHVVFVLVESVQGPVGRKSSSYLLFGGEAASGVAAKPVMETDRLAVTSVVNKTVVIFSAFMILIDQLFAQTASLGWLN
jgi:hypothetical protein